MWVAAACYSRSKHLEHIEELKKIKLEAFNYMNQIDKYAWCISYFTTHSKVYLIVNNLSERFNSTILEARSKQIVTTFEIIKRKMMDNMKLKRGNEVC